MLRIVESAKEITEGNRRFLDALRCRSVQKFRAALGFQGGQEEVPVFWLKDLGIWVGSRELENRYWNAFGVGEPDPKNSTITCEINFPFSGIDRSIAGAIGKDGHGKVYVIHRGKIGGGRAGIGKALFEEHYPAESVEVEDGDRTTRVTVLGRVDSPKLPKRISTFVKEVFRIKALVFAGGGAPDVAKFQHTFHEEFAGKKTYGQSETVEANCDHGVVVSELRSALAGEGLFVANDRNRDLYVYNDGGRIVIMFEVKTDTTLTNIYTAVGQLLLNSLDISPSPRLVLVAPADIGQETLSRLARLQILVLKYELSGDDVSFTGLKGCF